MHICLPNSALCFSSRLESSLLEVLQMDFEVEELSSPLDSQVIIWKLELPFESKNVAKTEGAMRIYTTQRDFVGLAPLVMVSQPTAYTSHLIIIKTSIDVTDSSVSNNDTAPLSVGAWKYHKMHFALIHSCLACTYRKLDMLWIV